VAAASLDTLILFTAATIILGSTWGARVGTLSPSILAMILGLLGTIAWTVTSAAILIAQRVAIRIRGPWAAIGGMLLVAFAGFGWIARQATPISAPMAFSDFLFPAGAMLVAYGWLHWSMEPSAATRLAVAADRLRDIVSTAAIMLAILIVMVGPGEAPADTLMGVLVRVAMTIGILFAGSRQVTLKFYEQRARSAATVSAARLAEEVEDRHRISQAMHGLEPGNSAVETAERICEHIADLPCVNFAVVTAVDEDGTATPLAACGLSAGGLVGRELEPSHAAHLVQLATAGPWTEPATPWLDEWVVGLDADSVPQATRVPLLWEDRLRGILTVGSRQPDDTERASRRLATATEIALVAGAMLGPALVADERARLRLARLDRVIADEAFYPVYQPIVELATGRVKGYEALTRFTDGTRPDLRFIEAAEAGRGIEMEVATLQAAVRGSDRLPGGAYLSINLSPDLASSPELLGPMLTRLPRPLLLEITEHVAVADYERLMASLYALDIQIRIAVDDAGAGYSGLQHILAIRPHVVKLDTTLVRSVDIDLARQALVGAMVSFTTRTGATVVAEGVETAAEAAMLRALGVELGQGYFFGRPARADQAGPTTLPVADAAIPGVRRPVLATAAMSSQATAASLPPLPSC
jgi:EAL domain-containing protein (putative c-di-GMP-specific phosphodiesterase class I)